MRLHLVVGPLVLVAMLQASGCTSEKLPDPPPPGGTYVSTSAGAFFDQSVMRNDGEAGDHIAAYSLQQAERPAHSSTKIVVGAADAGLVLSEDAGATWQQIGTPLVSVFDVVALSNGVLVVTGTDADGQGYIIRSADTGKSWEVSLTVPVPVEKKGISLPGLSGKPVGSVIISITADPFNPENVYAGTSLGSVLLGEQSGKTWRNIHTIEQSQLSPTVDQAALAITDIVASPHKAGEVLIINAKQELWRMSEEGQEKLRIPRNLENTDPLFGSSGQDRSVLSVAYVADSPEALFVGVDDGAVVTRDAGDSWSKLSLPVEAQQKFNTVVVAVSPTNTKRMLVAINDVVYRSEDGGVSWNTFSLQLSSHVVTQLLIDPTNPANVLTVTTPLKS